MAEHDAPTTRWSRTTRRPLFITALVLLAALLTTGLLADLVAPYSPTTVDARHIFRGPTPSHPFGTDRFGRDVLSRILFGIRVSLGIAAASIAVAVVSGSTLGLLAGIGRVVDQVLGRLMDVFFAFPPILLAIGIAAVLGAGPGTAVVAIAVVYAPLFSRVARGPVIAEREKEYVFAALGLGAGSFRVVFRHILPNVLAPLIVQVSVSLAYAILTEAALSYLGLGTQPPAPSWGTMLNEGRTYLETAPWMSIFPGIAIMFAVFGFNLLGDGLRAVLDPQLRGR